MRPDLHLRGGKNQGHGTAYVTVLLFGTNTSSSEKWEEKEPLGRTTWGTWSIVVNHQL